MKPGAAIINPRRSMRTFPTRPVALCHAKGATNFTAGLAQMLAEKGIRANTVAPGRSVHR